MLFTRDDRRTHSHTHTSVLFTLLFCRSGFSLVQPGAHFGSGPGIYGLKSPEHSIFVYRRYNFCWQFEPIQPMYPTFHTPSGRHWTWITLLRIFIDRFQAKNPQNILCVPENVCIIWPIPKPTSKSNAFLCLCIPWNRSFCLLYAGNLQFRVHGNFVNNSQINSTRIRCSV